MHVLIPRIPFWILRSPLGTWRVLLGFRKIRSGIPVIPACSPRTPFWTPRLFRESPRSQPASQSASQSASQPCKPASRPASRPAVQPASSQPASQPTRSRPASSRPGLDPEPKVNSKWAWASGPNAGARESIWNDSLAKTTRPRKETNSPNSQTPERTKLNLQP